MEVSLPSNGGGNSSSLCGFPDTARMAGIFLFGRDEAPEPSGILLHHADGEGEEHLIYP